MDAPAGPKKKSWEEWGWQLLHVAQVVEQTEEARESSSLHSSPAVRFGQSDLGLNGNDSPWQYGNYRWFQLNSRHLEQSSSELGKRSPLTGSRQSALVCASGARAVSLAVG